MSIDAQKRLQVTRITLTCLMVYFINRYFDTPERGWALVSVIFVMFDFTTVEGVVKKSLMRMLGTLMSAVYGILIIYCGADNIFLNLIAFTLGMFFYAHYFMTDNNRYVGLMGMVTLTIVLLNAHEIRLAILRSFNVLIGIFFSMLTMHFFYPQHVVKESNMESKKDQRPMMTVSKFPIVLTVTVLFLLFIYNFSYLFPFTNNAFVVANIRPVAANVDGYVTKIYIKNEQFIKKGSPLITVFKTPYALVYAKAQSDVAHAEAQLTALRRQVEKSEQLIQAQQAIYTQIHYDYRHYQQAARQQAVSKIQVVNFQHKEQAAFSQLMALKKQLALDRQNIIVQKYRIDSLIAQMKQAKVNLDETTVYAKNNGIVQNMYLSLGAPVVIRQPLFSFINTDEMYFQANYNETDLKHVKAGDKVTIYPRMYLGTKVYHGRVISKYWAVARQVTDGRSQEQIVTSSQNNWFLLPQRLPVQIAITDYDPQHYPLSVGASAYVYIHT